MKMIRVVAAVICDDIHTKHKIYATARGYGAVSYTHLTLPTIA